MNRPGPYGAGPPPPPPPRELKVEDALLYLDQVKLEFGDRPRIYNEFLEIMKNFKSNVIDTPGVIDRVRTLFRGYNKLILGFNTFLPDGYKIEMADLLNDLPSQPQYPQVTGRMPEPNEQIGFIKQSSPHGQRFMQVEQQRGGRIQEPDDMRGFVKQQSPHAQRLTHVEQPTSQQENQPPAAVKHSLPPRSQPQPQQPAIEFDHAISYVTTIKKRFANAPRIYQSFLEILHTYQKEQKGIREVLEQVAELFADHPDLLKQFTYFLPDAVQEQAKERLYKAAHESELRLASQQSQQKRVIDLVTPGAPVSDTKAKHSSSKAAVYSLEQMDKWVYSSSVERQFFDSVKEALVAGSRDGNVAWSGFLRSLDMYSQEQLSREEMLNCVEDLLGKRHVNLLQTFKQILHYVGTTTSPGKTTNPAVDDVWYSVPLAEIDFARCRQCTPSYRALPRDYPLPPCSARDEDDSKTLNNTWVSLPVGSEESYTFRHMRRNMHEEALFKVEDEKFEIDMAIDSNATTMKKLADLLPEINRLKKLSTAKGSEIVYKIPKDYFNTINKHCIRRIYGSDYGSEILGLVYQNPLQAVEIVYKRLKQKDEEWRAARSVMCCSWKSIQEANWTRSLDHRSLTYRTHDRRLTSTRSLLAEIRDYASNGGKESLESRNTRRDKAKEEYGSFYEITMPEKPKYPPTPPVPHVEGLNVHLGLQLDSEFIEDAYRIIIFGVEREKSAAPNDKDRTSIHRVFRDFLGDMFNISPSVMSQIDRCSKFNNVTNYNVGCGVATTYGTGEVVDVHDTKMTVKLPFGMAYLDVNQPCILYPTMFANPKLKEQPKVAIGNQYFYLFVRLFQLLCSRLKVARISSGSAETYESFLNTLYVLLDCKDSPEVAKYEERVRRLLGHGAYALLTMDKLIHHIIKHLTTLSLNFASANILKYMGTSTPKVTKKLESISALYNDHEMRSNLEKYKTSASIINTNQSQETLFAIEVNRFAGCLFIEYMGTGVSAICDTNNNNPSDSNTDINQEPSNKKARRV